MTFFKVGITLGDPGGIGPEVALKSLHSLPPLPDTRYVLFGSKNIIEYTKEALDIDFSLPNEKISMHEEESSPTRFQKGKPTSAGGAASFRYFEQAVQEAEKGNLQAIVTAPVSKKAWNLAGIPWAGHTEYLSRSFPEATMSFWSEPLKVALFTHHLSLKKAISKITEKSLFEFIMRLYHQIKEIHSHRFEFLVSGLNPHAGEQGLMGTEEKEAILPAIERARSGGVPVSGPYPPDVVFRHALNQQYKIVISLYHDQGLIPFKLLAFDRGVNVTLGLPFVRTSPDHGTAYEIAGNGMADPGSMMEAILLAHKFVTAS